MASTTVTFMQDGIDLEGPVLDALAAHKGTHILWVLYSYLRREAAREGMMSHAQLAKQLDLTTAYVSAAFRTLEKIGLVVIREGGTRELTVRSHTVDGRLIKLLQLIQKGAVRIEVKNAVVRHWKSSRDVDYRASVLNDAPTPVDKTGLESRLQSGVEACADAGADELTTDTVTTSADLQSVDEESGVDDSSHRHYMWLDNKSRNSTTGVKGISTRRNTGPEMYDPKAPKKHPNWLPVTVDFLPVKDGFDPKRDPYRADIEAIQAYANDSWNTSHGLYGAAGAPNERYGVIFRCLHHFGFSVDVLKKAIDTVETHDFWGPSKVRNLSNLFRKQSTIERLIDYDPPANLKYDRRALDMAVNPKKKGRQATVTEF